VLILRIKQAQCALADDRLDEAFEIAKADDVKRHRHGQRLIGRLMRAFIRRGRQNLEAGRFQPALADCNKAEKLAGNAADVAGLREAVCRAIAQRQQGHQQDAFRVAQARDNAADGWLSVGEQILADAPEDDGQALLLRQELAAARLQAEDAVAKAEQALKHGDIEMAVDLLRAAGVTKNRNGQMGQLLRQISRQAGEQARVSFEQGRVDRAQSLLQRLAPLGVEGEEVTELRRAVTQCHQAAECVAAGQPAVALPLLRKVKTMYPSAKWLDKAVAEVRQAAEALEELDAGPLGLSIADAAGAADGGPETDDGGRRIDDRGQKTEDRHSPSSVLRPRSSELPSEFVMQMDGIGSYLVFRDSRITVGPISSSKHPTLGLMAEPSLPVVSIERMDDDYFLRCEQGVLVNGSERSEKLLTDGDTIALSARCRLRFRLPNPASPTAVLMLSGARLGRPDIRQVILMGRDILAGPYTNNHIQTEHLEETITFFCQNDRLLCRATKPVTVDDRPMQPEKGLTLDKPIRIGKLSMVLAKFHT
jgi:hypothetical protein